MRKGSEIFIHNYVKAETNGGHAFCPKSGGSEETK